MQLWRKIHSVDHLVICFFGQIYNSCTQSRYFILTWNEHTYMLVFENDDGMMCYYRPQEHFYMCLPLTISINILRSHFFLLFSICSVVSFHAQQKDYVLTPLFECDIDIDRKWNFIMCLFTQQFSHDMNVPQIYHQHHHTQLVRLMTTSMMIRIIFYRVNVNFLTFQLFFFKKYHWVFMKNWEKLKKKRSSRIFWNYNTNPW